MMNRFSPLVALSVLLPSAAALATPVFTNGNLYSYTHDNRYGDGNQSTTLVQGDGSASSSVPSAQNAATADFNLAGNTLNWGATFSQSIGAPAPDPFSYYDWWYGQVNGYRGDIYAQTTFGGTFTLEAGDAGYTYDLSAVTSQTGTSQLVLYASFYDMTAGQQLYYLNQAYNAPSNNGTMSLGVGGDYREQMGATSGELIAGHSYNVVFYSYVRHWNNGSTTWTNPYNEGAASAQGSFNVLVQGPAPAAVPEPSSLALLGLGLGAGAFLARRRKA